MTPTHLSDAEFVDLLEATLAPERATHIEGCDACRAQADSLRASLQDAASTEVPEPSPLFWDHMTARVREAIALESPPSGSVWEWRGRRGLASLAAAAALIIAVGGGALLLRGGRSPVPAESERKATAAAAGVAAVTSSIDPETAAAWEVLTSAASDVEIEDAHAAGMTPHDGAIDYAVLSLSPAELAELGRLLQTEMKRASN